MANCIAYVETNFLVGVATGREVHGDDLLTVVSTSVKIAMPSVCQMEAFSALEDERSRRHRFKNQLEQQIGQVRRDVTSAHARSLLSHLEQSSLLSDRLLNDVQDRLFRYMERSSTAFEFLQLPPEVLRASVNNVLIADPTDNLILHIILEHARRTPATEKALLTGNYSDFDTPDVRTALQSVGINKYFRSVDNLRGWLTSLPT